LLFFLVHCWDYRRFVVAKAKISADNEFQFCDDKIQKNFSNYSSWHYRSQLLPILHPHETDAARPISEEKLREELELVITAAFTDPNDSSAWFYQRWLLGYSNPALDLAAIKITSSQAIVSFTRPINMQSDGIEVHIDSIPELSAGKWRSISGAKSDAIWIQEGDFPVSAEQVLVTMKTTTDEHQLQASKQDSFIVGIKLPKFGYEFGSAVITELTNQLDSCNQLLDYEPDSKWTLLTAALLMRSIDRCSFHQKSLEFMRKLEQVDKLRAGYYKDLASKWIVEMKLKEWIDSGDFRTGALDLSNLDLTTVYYSQYVSIATRVDLQGNSQLNRNSCKFGNVKDCEVKF